MTIPRPHFPWTSDSPDVDLSGDDATSRAIGFLARRAADLHKHELRVSEELRQIRQANRLTLNALDGFVAIQRGQPLRPHTSRLLK